MKLSSLLFLFSGVMVSTFSQADTTIRIGHATPEVSPIHQSLLYFEKELESRSLGKIQVEIFPGGQLGGVRDMTELVQSGSITMTTGASVHLSSTVNELAVLDQFLLFPDEETARDVLDGKAGKALGKAIETRGLKSMGFMELGFRSFTNNRAPLDSYESFKGLRMRSADNPIAIKAWRSVDAVPVPLAWGEIYSSLQQNLIDGQESALSSMIIERFFEVQKYVSLTKHIYWPELWISNLDWYQDLSSYERTLIDKVARETVVLQRQLTFDTNTKTLDELKAKGLKVNSLSDKDRKRLGETMNSSIEDDIRKKVGDAFYEDFMNALNQ